MFYIKGCYKVSNASRCPCLTLIQIVIMLVYDSIPFIFRLVWHYFGTTFHYVRTIFCLAKDHKGGLNTLNIRMVLTVYSSRFNNGESK